jgi:hypothetical protein
VEVRPHRSHRISFRHSSSNAFFASASFSCSSSE